MSLFQKRGLAGLFCLLLLASAFPCHASAVSTSATSALLMDVDSGRVLYARNADTQMRIASTTKIMTALVALENAPPGKTVTVQRTATLTEGSSMYLKAGEKLTLETLLYGLLLCSGNDAAMAVADAFGGVVPFAALMNQKAVALGMTGTHFDNPSGLDGEAHYSTARDMGRLAAAAMENETFARIVSTRSVTMGGRTMTNHNKLLSTVEGCIGLKTGYTKAAGRTLVSCAVRNGQRLVAVTLQDGNDWADHAALLDYGFAAYPAQKIISGGETVTRLSVEGGTAPSLALLASGGFAYPLAAGEKLTQKLELPPRPHAPLAAGQPMGCAIFYLDGREVGRVALQAASAVALTLPAPTLFHKSAP
ncbi:MAG: D-alanyl-D-alanine carboxypeptidase family protein [Oscillospiraceae bacterium]